MSMVVFVHPDGREVDAVAVINHSDGSLDLVAFEGSTAPFGGTKTYEGVPHSTAGERYSWHGSAEVTSAAPATEEAPTVE